MNKMPFTREVLSLIEQYDLGDAVKYILERSVALALPYHNFSHGLWVMLNAHTAWTWPSEKTERDDEDIRELLLASLFHDFNHSGGLLKPDSRNVALAIYGFSDYIEFMYANGKSASTDFEIVS